MKLNSPVEIWQAALQQLQKKVSPANYQTWLKDTVGLAYKNNRFTVGVPSTFANDWVEQHLHSLVEKILTGITGRQIEANFQVSLADGQSNDGNPGNPPEANGHVCPALSQPEHLCGAKFRTMYTFDTFVEGSCNRMAYAASKSVAEKPGSGYNPLFIYGGSGLGKTHLLHAIGWDVIRSYPHTLYVTAEQFTNEFITAIRERNTEEFRNKYRSVDALLIDDVQFIAGKEQTQEGLFHTFNDLHNSNRQIVVSSDRPPKSLALLEDRLRSRFEWGLTVDMQPPDLETRLAILQTKAREHQAQVPADVFDLIARRVQKNIRELEGALNRVIAYSRITKAPLTLDSANEALSDIASDLARRNLTKAGVLKGVSVFYGIDAGTITGKKRDKPISMARHVTMYLLREELHCSWTEIGNELGGRDHSTVIHGYEKIASDIHSDSSLHRDVLEIREKLYSK